jgi:protein-tyrosine phosphatase
MGDPAPKPGPTAAQVLCVCTANVCRSPAAELLLRAGLGTRGDGGGIEVLSAGTWASDDRPVEPGTATALRRHGVPAGEVEAKRSIRLTREAVARADLVIASTAEHVRAVWRLQLAARHRTFTLGELARLTEGIADADLPDADPSVRLRVLVTRADALREERRPPHGPYVTEAYDLTDPTDNDPAQRDMVAQTAEWAELVLDLVAGPAQAGRARPYKVPGVARALQWSRHITARGATR